MTAHCPVELQADGNACRNLCVGVQSPLERGSQIFEFDIELLSQLSTPSSVQSVTRSLGDFQISVHMLRTNRFSLSGFHQAVTSILPDCLHKPISRDRSFVDLYERLLDKLSQRIEDIWNEARAPETEI